MTNKCEDGKKTWDDIIGMGQDDGISAEVANRAAYRKVIRGRKIEHYEPETGETWFEYENDTILYDEVEETPARPEEPFAPALEDIVREHGEDLSNINVSLWNMRILRVKVIDRWTYEATYFIPKTGKEFVEKIMARTKVVIS